MRWLVVTVIAACGGPSFDDGDFRCGPSSECPPGLICKEGLCRRTGDAPASDTTQLDAGAADAPPTPDADPAALCTAQYGSATAFLLCQATTSECEFYAETGTSCTTFCERYGGTCRASFDEVDGTCTKATTDQVCLGSHDDQICVCTLD